MFSKTLMIILIINCVLDSYGQKSKKFFRADYTYMEAFDSFYKIQTLPQNWTDAKRTCALEGATFWHPDNDDEATALISFSTRTKPNIRKINVALTDSLVEGVFITVEGKPVSEVYNNWQQNAPDNYQGNQDCVRLNFHKKEMDDEYCDYKWPFICKKSLQTLEWNYMCDIPDLDYAYNKENGKCYKFHTTPLNWNEAFAMCQVEQSSLAVISNQLEADYLSKLTESTPKPRIKQSYQKGIYHLGFHSKLTDGWQTVKGTPLNVDQDAWFDNHQPDGDSHEQCGSMFYTGRLTNSPCEMRSFFICEHEVDNQISPASVSSTDSEQPFLQPYVGGGIE